MLNAQSQDSMCNSSSSTRTALIRTAVSCMGDRHANKDPQRVQPLVSAASAPLEARAVRFTNAALTAALH